MSTGKGKINWEKVKTITITAFIFTIAGLIGGYFASINLHSDARQSVISDMSVVTKLSPKSSK